jgi:single-strand DNA-binding protein
MAGRRYGMIKVTLLGRVGSDPVLRNTKTGKTVANFSVADNQKEAGEQKTTWYSVSCWDAKAEIAEKIVRKGDLVYVEGVPSVSSWTDKQGTSRNEISISCRFLQVEKQKKDGAPQETTAALPSATMSEDIDIPF